MTERLFMTCARCADAGFTRCLPHIPASFFDPPGRWLFLFGDLRPPPARDLFDAPPAELVERIKALGPHEILWVTSRRPVPTVVTLIDGIRP